MLVLAGLAGMADPPSLPRQTRLLKVARTMPKVLLRCNSGTLAISHEKSGPHRNSRANRSKSSN
ncbi:hypothetical protein HYPGJ_21067 [Hyphomicrobium sp. GJ21]|nr:hypothetical protein HYPGJ_21067 [Hyphomicrobium sp. GJ21]